MAEPVPAATVVLAREGMPTGRPWQCFMVRRHVLSDFASNVWVFPGGKVDPEDREATLEGFCSGHPPPAMEETEVASWRFFRLAAIRELFEEAGVLLARREGAGNLSLDGDACEVFSNYREKMQAGTMTLLELATQESLTFPLDHLHQISRWITPPSFPKRFDTHFFAAFAPEGQTPIHDRHETTESIWIAPEEALERYRTGSFPLVFATEKHLERMVRHSSLDSLVTSVTPADLEPVMPRAVQENGETRYLIPGDRDY
ncbi:MAG: NUDIX hydrolase [Chloroflexota bacterium]